MPFYFFSNCPILPGYIFVLTLFKKLFPYLNNVEQTASEFILVVAVGALAMATSGDVYFLNRLPVFVYYPHL